MFFLLFKVINEVEKKFEDNFSVKGQGMVEYAIMLAVVAIIAVAVFVGSGGGGRNFGESVVNRTYDKAAEAINEINIPEVSESTTENP